MKQYRKNNDKIEVVTEQVRVIDVEMIEREIEMLDTQIANFEAKRKELQKDIREINKLL